MKRTLRSVPGILWRRLPHIALYALVFYVLFFVGQRAFYHFAPSTFFLDYYSVNVPATPRHFVGEPVPFTVCRHKRGNYPVRGYRIIYKVEGSSNRSDAKQVANYPINGQITQNECSDVVIAPKDYPHQEGSYYFKTVLNFRVNGEDKQVAFTSNTYTIEPKQLTPSELQQKIEALENEIQKLKLQLELSLNGRTNTQTTTTTNTPATSTTPASSSTTQTNTSTPRPEAQKQSEAKPQPQPTPQSCTFSFLFIKVGCNE